MRVLLIEDDKQIGDGLVAALKAAGMAVDWARDGLMALEALRDPAYAIALLDLGLPGADGMTVLKSARQHGIETPVLIITARDAVESRVTGLDHGADDYLVKPFEVPELLARMRALLRRRAGQTDSRLITSEAVLDTATHQFSCGGRTETLSARGYALMRVLMERPGHIFSRVQIEEYIYGWGEEVESNAVEVLIHSLRRKFGKGVILNIRGAGWMVPK
ncbi:MAG: response regulator transcription factor [Rhodospirillales bacterium]|nr:response regulator transcription factor [Rhodospirillales bacterium]